MNIYFLEANGRFDVYRFNRNRKLVCIGSFSGDEIFIEGGAYSIGKLRERVIGICGKKGITLDDLFVSNLKLGIKE